MKTCKVKGCNNKHEGLGYCAKHYQRFKKYGCSSITYLEMHGLRYSPEYTVWKMMKQRCYLKSHKSYKNYGKRGIIVCDRWKNSFNNFYSDMGKRPTNTHQIDRIDNNGNYEPINCRWVTPTENIRNSSRTKLTIYKAREIRKLYKEYNISQAKLAKKYFVSRANIGKILNNETWKEN